MVPGESEHRVIDHMLSITLAAKICSEFQMPVSTAQYYRLRDQNICKDIDFLEMLKVGLPGK